MNSSKAGVWPGSSHPAGLRMWATLADEVWELTLPMYSSMSLGLLPAAWMRVGCGINVGFRLPDFGFRLRASSFRLPASAFFLLIIFVPYECNAAERWKKTLRRMGVVHFGSRSSCDEREIPRPAGKNAGLRDDALKRVEVAVFSKLHYYRRVRSELGAIRYWKGGVGGGSGMLVSGGGGGGCGRLAMGCTGAGCFSVSLTASAT